MDFFKNLSAPPRNVFIPAKKKGNRVVQAGLPFYVNSRLIRRVEKYLFCVITAKRHAALR